MTSGLASRRAPVWLLVVTGLVLLPWSMAVNLWFAEQGHWRPLLHASDGWLHPALQACLPSVAVYLLLFRCGGLRLSDVGWRRATFVRGAAATVGLWLAVQALAAVADGFTFACDPRLNADAGYYLGNLLGQWLGNALWEETVYRGFFLAQFLLLLRARGLGWRRAAWLAAWASAVIFAVPHIPNRIYKDAYAGPLDVLADQGRLLVSGMLLAWIYLRTRNLWWAVGLHGLANHPTSALVWPGDVNTLKITIVLLGILVTACWPRTRATLTTPCAAR